ncbi:hypothetical protein FOZ63_001625, partial [Perkinsus olseni]
DRVLEDYGAREFIRHCHARASLGLPVRAGKLREVLRNSSTPLEAVDEVRCLHAMALADRLPQGDDIGRRVLESLDGGFDNSLVVQQLRLFMCSTRASTMVQADTPGKCGQTGLNRQIGIYLRKNFPQGTWVSNAKVTDGDRGSVSMDYWCPEHGSVEVLGPAR